MSDLPHGWAHATIEQLAGPRGLTTDGDWIETKDQDPNGDVRLIQLADIGDGEFRDRSARFVTTDTAHRLNCTFLENDDLLIARMPDPLGRACIFPGVKPAITAVDVFVWRPSPGGPLAKWLMHFVNSADVRNRIAEQAGGTTRQRIAGGRVKELVIPVPPLPEQRRIVAKIDSLSAKSQRSRGHLGHIPRLVEKHKQAILAAAFRRDLTRNWCATNASRVRPEWNKGSLIDICDPQRPITYGVIKLGSEIPDGVPCLRTSNVRWLRVDTEGMKRISPKLSSEYARTIIRGGEVLVNVRGTLGGVAVATPGMKGWNVSREVAVVPVDTAIVEPDYLAYWVGADLSQRWLNRVEKGVAYTGINIEDLRKLPVKFPSIEEQREIVRWVRAAHSKIDLMAKEAKCAATLLVRFDKAILAKAFRGELVPQDSNDEPASILLERIRAERAAAPAKAKRGRGQKGA
jgi:type I restriction enzyme S subunit